MIRLPGEAMLPDLTTYTDADLSALNVALSVELQRRQTPLRLAALFAEQHARHALEACDCQTLADQAQRLATPPVDAPTEPILPVREVGAT